MTTALLCSLLVATVQENPVADYFPVQPGAKWVYEESMKEGRNPARTSTFTDVAGEPEEVLGIKAIPFRTLGARSNEAAVHYLFQEDTVQLLLTVKVDGADTPIKYPVLKFTDRETTFDYSGLTNFAGDPVDMILIGRSKKLGARKVLDQNTDVLEVKLDIIINVLPEDAFGSLQGATLRSEQTALYAKGIGLFQLTEKIRIGNSNIERNRKLIAFTPATK